MRQTFLQTHQEKALKSHLTRTEPTPDSGELDKFLDRSTAAVTILFIFGAKLYQFLFSFEKDFIVE